MLRPPRVARAGAERGSAMDVVIVGAGIVGAASALALARAGCRVTVVEERFPGGGATAAGMGHVVVIDDSPAQIALTSRGRALWESLAPHLPAAAEYRRPGTAWVAAAADELAEAAAKAERLAAAGVAARLIGPEELAHLEPALRPGLAGALVVPDDAVVYPPPVAAWMVAEAVAAGARLRRGVAATAVEPGGVLRLADGGRIEADAVVVATGAAAARLVPGVPIRPRKGHLVITDRAPGLIHHQVVELGYVKRAHDVGTDSVAFNVQPRATGQVLVGSSRQIDVTSPAVEPKLLETMLARCFEYLPRLATVPAIRVWTGLRAATPDGLPLVGPWPAIAGLWLATGHEGLGITTAPATAEGLVAGLLGRDAVVDPAPWLPARFLAVPVEAAR